VSMASAISDGGDDEKKDKVTGRWLSCMQSPILPRLPLDARTYRPYHNYRVTWQVPHEEIDGWFKPGDVVLRDAVLPTNDTNDIQGYLWHGDVVRCYDYCSSPYVKIQYGYSAGVQRMCVEVESSRDETMNLKRGWVTYYIPAQAHPKRTEERWLFTLMGDFRWQQSAARDRL